MFITSAANLNLRLQTDRNYDFQYRLSTNSMIYFEDPSSGALKYSHQIMVHICTKAIYPQGAIRTKYSDLLYSLPILLQR